MIEILNEILCCPDCGGSLIEKEQAMTCTSCFRDYHKYRMGEKNIPVLLSSKSAINFASDASQYGLKEKKTWLSKLARLIWPPEPTRFYGDLQSKFKITNYHVGVHNFIEHCKKDPCSIILDLGGGHRRLGDGIVNIDVFVSPMVDVTADANFLPIRECSVDAIILQTVLEHINTYEDVLRQTYRVLKQGGCLFCEVPFYYPVHAEADFIRITPKMLKFLLNKIGFGIEEFKLSAGPFSALSLSLRTIPAIILSFGYKRLFTFWYILIGWLTFWIKYLDILYPHTEMLEWIAPTFYIIAKKAEV